MKKVVVLCTIFALLCILSKASAYDNPNNRINAYNQMKGSSWTQINGNWYATTGDWDRAVSIQVKANGNSKTLANRGCGLFTYAHAIQWLTGQKADSTRQIAILNELLSKSNDPPNANGIYRDYIVSKYGSTYGIAKASCSKDWASMTNVFDQGGVFVVNPSNSSGGHFCLCVGYTEAYVDGSNQKLLLMVDSSTHSTLKRLPGGQSGYVAYNYSLTGRQTYTTSTTSDYGFYWIRYSDLSSSSSIYLRAAFTSATAKELAKPTVMPSSIQLNKANDVIYLNISGITLTATAYPSNASQAVTWTTSNSSVATVSSSGVVTPTGLGTVRITATSTVDPTVSASCDLEVKYNGTGSITFNSVIFPYKYKISSKGFSWKSGSGTISSDVNLNYVIFTIIHPNGTTKSYRYPTSESATIGAKSLEMSTVDSIIKFSEVTSAGEGYFQIKVVDSAGRTMTLGRNFDASTTEGASASTDSIVTQNRYYKITTQYKDPELKDSTTLNGHRYERYEASYSWTEAKSYAEKIGGHLATINSAEENAAVYSLVKKNGDDWGAWLGGYRSSNSWYWVKTDEAFSYQNWYTNEPNNLWGQENYLAMRVTEGKWRDTSNNSNNWRFFIVEFEPKQIEQVVIEGETVLTVGDTTQLQSTILPVDAYNPAIIYTSSDTSVATVNANTGIVTAIGEGDVIIYAIAQDSNTVKGQMSLHVNHPPIHPTSVILSVDESLYTGTKTISVQQGTEFVLFSTIYPTDADDQGVSFTISDSDIISIEDYTSTATALDAGTCQITVATDDGNYTDTITVNVLPISGKCGENATWSYSDGVLTISGTGAITDYTVNSNGDNRPWADYKSSIHTVIVNQGITSIGECSFESFSALNSVSLPDSVTSIRTYSFRLCSSLETIELPDSIIDMGSIIFDGCYSLKSIHLPENLKSIPQRAFHNCRKLASIQIPDSVTSIGSNAFLNCESLESIEIPDSVTSLGHSSFLGCTGLTSVSLSRNLKVIPYNCFHDCIALKSMVIPDSVTTIGYCAFENCNSLEDIVIPKSVTGIDVSTENDEVTNGAFTSCSKLIIHCYAGTAAHLYAKSNSIPYTLLDTVFPSPDFIIPSGLKVIDEESFTGIAATRVKLPENATTIRNNAFADCPNLVCIYIPEGCTSIATTAFSGVDNLTIFGIEGSYAEFYASKRGYEFVAVTP